MTTDRIRLREVSKFYGEILGVNRVTLDIEPGLTGLVGPNGSGKSTLMHLLTGLLRPSHGEISVCGIPPDRPEELFAILGYCTQYDGFPSGATGLSFLTTALALQGREHEERLRRAWEVLELVGLAEAGRRRVAGYSKGMRQRLKLGHALAHDPQVLVLDEPLNGLDPMARTQVIHLLRTLAAAGRHVLVSSHILHEVDEISDRVVMIHGGAVVAEGEIRAVRGEITRHPVQVLIRCDQPRPLAASCFGQDHVVEARLLDDGRSLLVRTRDAAAFFHALTGEVLRLELDVESVLPADESVRAVYDYLIGGEGGGQ